MSTEAQAQPVVSEVSKEVTSTETPTPTVESTTAEQTSPEELLKQGKSLDNADDGIDLLSRALELIVIKHGELHPETAPYYHEYGRRLIESSKRDQDVFAKIEAQVNKPEEEKQEDCEEVASEEKETGAQTGTAAAEAASTAAEQDRPAEDAGAKPAEDAGAKPAEGSAGSSGKMEVGEEERPTASAKDEAISSASATDSAELIEARELAWQLLETARVIYSKDEQKNISEIAAVHCLLGDVAMEDGNFQRAYPEYVKATQIYGKHAGMADRRLGEAHQLAGLCALYDQQNEASIFHYTAAAEAFNNTLTELLVKESIMERPSQDTEDIEFVDEQLLEKLKEKLGKENPTVGQAHELNGIVNNLIERVEEIQDQAEADAKNPQMKEIIMKLGQEIAKKFASVQDKEGGSSAFDKPTSAPCEGAKEINVLVPKKRPAPEAEGDATGAAKRQKLDTAGEA